MSRQKLNLNICIILLIGCTAFPGAAAAHHLTVAQILRILNQDAIKARTGIQEAAVDPKLQRHLIIKVSDAWYRLSEPRRRELAAAWLRAWKQAITGGIVSILDAASHEPAVNFSPSGSVSLTKKQSTTR